MLTYLSHFKQFYSLKRVFAEAYSWLASHESVLLLGLFLLVWADILIRQTPRPLLTDWAFWIGVVFWILILLGTSYVKDKFTRIRHSIRLALYLSGLSLALGTALVGFILRLSELYWPPIVGLFAVFIIATLHNVFQDMTRSRVLPPITFSPEEQSILRIAQELSYNFQLSKRFDPQYITWTNDIFSDEVAFEDGFQRRNLLLPLSLKNELSPEELKVLIADYLLQRKAAPEKFVISLVRFFSPLIVYAIVFVYEARVIVSIPYADVAWLIGYVLIATLAFRPFLAEGKKQSLAIDRATAKLVGQEFFLSVLKKIYELKLHDMQRLSAKRDLRAKIFSFFKPTLEERMDNLTRM